MKTATLIQPYAEVVRVTTLRRGDVYKRLEDKSASTYNESDGLVFGVVTDVLDNGEQTAVTAIEVSRETLYETRVKLRTFAGGRDVAIFPATPDEVRLHLADGLEQARTEVERAERSLSDARHKLSSLEDINNGDLAKRLRPPVTAKGEDARRLVEAAVAPVESDDETEALF